LQLSPARWDAFVDFLASHAFGIQNLRHGDFAAPFTELLHLRQFLWGDGCGTLFPVDFLPVQTMGVSGTFIVPTLGFLSIVENLIGLANSFP
jgi:hypothetical protein